MGIDEHNIYEIRMKLRGISYLIEQLGGANSPPERPQEVYYGIGRLLEGLENDLKNAINFDKATIIDYSNQPKSKKSKPIS